MAVITGGANGIGLACAQRFLGAGMRVVLADRDADALAAAPGVLSADSNDLHTVVCDVSDYEQVIALRDEALATFGRVDCLMNNAGAIGTRAVPWDDLAGWRAQLDINLWGIIHGCQAFVPGMLEAGQP
ncbi:MAG: SDR family NAD(P)-dependent oxidoreductase, partial [Pseudomonadota bacterium]